MSTAVEFRLHLPCAVMHGIGIPLGEAAAAMEQQVHPSRLVHQYGIDGNRIADGQGDDDTREEGEF